MKSKTPGPHVFYFAIENNYSINTQLFHFISNDGYQRFRQSDGQMDG